MSPLLFAVLLAAVAWPAAAQPDLQLVVQMPLAVVEVEEVGYPRDDLDLLVGSLFAADLAPADTIDILRWSSLAWYVDELTDDDVVLRLVEAPDGVWVLTDRDVAWFDDGFDRFDDGRRFDRDGDLVVFDRDRVVRDRDVVVVDRDVVLDRDRDRDRDALLRRADGPGMGAYVQRLHARGLRGGELADAIHRELRRRGVPAGPKARLDGPPPVSPRFVSASLPARLEIDGRRVELRGDDVGFVPVRRARQRVEIALRDGGGVVLERDGRDGRGRSAASGKPAGAGRGDERRGGSDAAGPGRGHGRGDAPARESAGSRGQGRGKAVAGGPGGGHGRGKGKAAARGGGGGGGKGKAAGHGGGGGGGGKGKAAGRGGGGGGGRGKGGGGKG